MIFINNGDDIQIRMEYTNPGYNWKILRKGKTIELPESVGLSYNLQMETTKGKIGKVNVETKQIAMPLKDFETEHDFFKELNLIKGIGKHTAQDIVNIFKTREELIKHVKADDVLPLRNDIEKKLRKHYD